jgi:hypothetical protein
MTQNQLRSRRSGRAFVTAERLEDRCLMSVGSSQPAISPVNFDKGIYTVSAQTGQASIVLDNNEFPGPDGLPTASPQQVYLSFSSGTAVPGVDYTPAVKTITFASGQGSQTVQLPVLPGSASEGTRTVELDLSAAPGGPPISAAFLVITHNADTTPPQVVATKMLTRSPYVTGFVITFSKDMAPGPVQDVSNYEITDPRSIRPIKGADMTIAPREIRLKSAFYDRATHSVTLNVAKKVRKFPFFMIEDRQFANLMKIVANAVMTHSTPSAPMLIPQLSPITDTTGNPLDSTGTGTPDGHLLAMVTHRKAGNPFVSQMNQLMPLPSA